LRVLSLSFARDQLGHDIAHAFELFSCHGLIGDARLLEDPLDQVRILGVIAVDDL